METILSQSEILLLLEKVHCLVSPYHLENLDSSYPRVFNSNFSVPFFYVLFPGEELVRL